MLNIMYDPTLPPEGPSRQPQHAAFEQELRRRGLYLGGGGLYPQRAAKRVRRREGRPLVSDGPFPETKEALGGFFVVQCELEEALELAAGIDVDPRSWVEVRQVGIWRPL
jgi:hypothetical protein